MVLILVLPHGISSLGRTFNAAAINHFASALPPRTGDTGQGDLFSAITAGRFPSLNQLSSPRQGRRRRQHNAAFGNVKMQFRWATVHEQL